MTEKKSIFTPVSEKEVTRAIVDGFAKDGAHFWGNVAFRSKGGSGHS